jgi:nitroimidazol reductase NimA-like FMN-containing flavoprotein (pyridoxamine 5'-phosphate oxidase superfamily)
MVANDTRWFPARVHDLDVKECWEMLAGREIGRIGFLDGLGPLVIPVTFVVDNGSVVFRVAPYSTLGQHIPGAQVAFEVDDIDDANRSGWSVVLRGRAEVIHPEEIPDLSERPEPWAEGRRPLHLRLTPDDVTGRRLVSP